MLSTLVKTILYCAAIGAIISCFTLFGSVNYLADLLSNFRIQYLVLLTLPLLLSAVTRHWKTFLILLAAFSLHAGAVTLALIPTSESSQSANCCLKVMSTNLLAPNTAHEGVYQSIRQAYPDIVVFQEYTPAWDRYMLNALNDYPFRGTVAEDNPFGIALFSKLPIKTPEIVIFDRAESPSIKVAVNWKGQEVTVIGTHPVPPVSSSFYRSRNNHLRALGAFVAQHEGSLVIAGDLNISTWSSGFRRLLKNAGLRDARQGQGIFPTWPTFLRVLLIPIDHILVTRDLKVTEFETVQPDGSDHRSIWASISD